MPDKMTPAQELQLSAALGNCFDIPFSEAKKLTAALQVRRPESFAAMATAEETQIVLRFLGKTFSQIEHQKRKQA